ncbi:MAG: tryptophan--tRNA ligase, partial [Clostridia bacterium]
MAEKKRILTGDRPTGRLHIGHYFGSLQKRVEMQNSGLYDPYILIADVQALTDNFNNPDKVRKNVREVAMDYLSCGIDPEKSTIYIQSMIPEVAELTVFYSNLVTIARLERNPTVKTEIAQKRELFGESVTYGFLGYPVSQAADITCFNGELIPVGEDQLPLIEQCREIVRKFNSIYGDVLIEPEAVLSSAKRIKGLDGNEKMGKSLGNAIYLSDSEEEITRKVMSAVTDPKRIKKDDLGNPEVCMVAYYHNLFSSKEEYENVCKECRA